MSGAILLLRLHAVHGVDIDFAAPLSGNFRQLQRPLARGAQ